MTAIDEMIANKIIESIDSNEGDFSLEIEVDDNIFVEVSGCYEIEGYEENDYYNGTGAWVTTYAWVAIDKCEVSAYNEDGDEIETDVKPNISEIESYIEQQLKY